MDHHFSKTTTFLFGCRLITSHPMSAQTEISIRTARESDLGALNEVIEACVMGWNLPERVKRLSLGSYRYQPHDLAHL
jgi:hypothetical protein